MKAGQRNCCIEISGLIDRYSLDDVLFAVREQIIQSENINTGAKRKICADAVVQLDQLRKWMSVVNDRTAAPQRTER